MRTTGTVSRVPTVALDRDRHVLLPVEQPVDRLLPVAARDDDGGGAERVDRLGELPAPYVIGVWDSGQSARLVQIRSNHGCKREEPVDENCNGVVEQEFRPGGSHHDRIDDERKRVLPEEVGDRRDDRPAEEHPRLGCVDADVVEDGAELRTDEVRRQLVNIRDTDGVLGGEGHDPAHPVAVQMGEGLEVGLDAGAAAGIRRRDRETARDHRGAG
jgi:hypothetical protein